MDSLQLPLPLVDVDVAWPNDTPSRYALSVPPTLSKTTTSVNHEPTGEYVLEPNLYSSPDVNSMTNLEMESRLQNSFISNDL